MPNSASLSIIRRCLTSRSGPSSFMSTYQARKIMRRICLKSMSPFLVFTQTLSFVLKSVLWCRMSTTGLECMLPSNAESAAIHVSGDQRRRLLYICDVHSWLLVGLKFPPFSYRIKMEALIFFFLHSSLWTCYRWLYFSFLFPDMRTIGHGLLEVIDALSIAYVIGLGEGAGANILARFGMDYPQRSLGLILIHCTSTVAGVMEYFRDKVNPILHASAVPFNYDFPSCSHVTLKQWRMGLFGKERKKKKKKIRAPLNWFNFSFI